ncbi:MAG: DUF1491 family protein [Pseudomonadota bacterium]
MSSRLRSDLFVQSLIRIAEGMGGFALVRHRGHDVAGIVHLVIEEAVGKYSVYVERPYATGAAGWVPVLEQVDASRVDRFFEKERSFDRDLWAVEIEGGVRIGDMSV